MTPSLIHFPHFCRNEYNAFSQNAVAQCFCLESLLLRTGPPWAQLANYTIKTRNTRLNILKLGHRDLLLKSQCTLRSSNAPVIEIFFASLWRANSSSDSCVLGVHLSNVCWDLLFCRSSFKSALNLRKAFIFKSLLKVYHRSVFNKSSKALIFQKCAESLHSE